MQIPYRFAPLVGVAALVLAACGDRQDSGQPAANAQAQAAEERILNVYNWPDYVAPDTIPNFERQTGIKVNYDVYDSNELLETKLLTGRSGYDVVFPSASFLERQIETGVFMKLDKAKVPNLENADPEIMRRLALHDPGNEHAAPYMWGTTGIGYNPVKVKAALGTDTIDSWSAIFDPQNAAKLEDCGLVMLDAPSEVFDSALIYLGKDPNSESPDDLAAAEALIMGVQPYIRYFHSQQYYGDLASGEICIALGWSGDVLLARTQGAGAATPVDITYVIPKEGAVVWFDGVAIPADAPHPDNAHRFINYLMEPAVAAAVSNYVAFPNANAAAYSLVDETLRSDPAVYPPPEAMARLYPSRAESQEYSRLSNRAWTAVRTGQ